MSDPILATATRPLRLDDLRVKKGDRCTVLREQPDASIGTLLEVMFADGVRRFVRHDDVEVTP